MTEQPLVRSLGRRMVSSLAVALFVGFMSIIVLVAAGLVLQFYPLFKAVAPVADQLSTDKATAEDLP